jgi:hypothetical protein
MIAIAIILTLPGVSFSRGNILVEKNKTRTGPMSVAILNLPTKSSGYLFVTGIR